MDKLYARDIYGKVLIELGKKDPDLVVLDADLSGSTRTARFGKEFPERFFNFGVAEQNMMATAAGLARCGKVVFASTFAMFATARAFDQVRNTISYSNLNVKIVATHGGITVGEDGASHQAIEDINLFRAIPNMKIIIPADAPEAKEAILAAYKTPGPFYIRLGRSKVSSLEKRKKFSLGKGYLLRKGKDVAIISCGIMVKPSLDAAEILKEQGISASVANIHTIKPPDQDFIIKLAKTHKKIVVCEEHQTIGGLYSTVAEILVNKYPLEVEKVGIENRFGQSGSPNELLKYYGLTADNIAKKTKKFLQK
ncbi:MAG: transketolase family protein [Candidatus Omnitrophica bacterium]|nr:transketolase family protein [Candidatus Omnitrophota bacterium]MCF7891771.1 transketolase family protein [Candidatus Omnitrophota bacterium]MCF7895555.1 transketolase family protein [Candidatus Omnitrophota bacterium]MCF7897228.1 transketolase family protein [Candidatus Omnitrophota bacterium]MCF7909808.1 transketolase family protein [Candidatus Omnitrophota bacterium]